MAVIAAVLGVAVYAVPHTGSGSAYGSDDTATTTTAEDTVEEDLLALPPGMDSIPGLPEIPVPGEPSDDADPGAGTGSEQDAALRDWATRLTGVDISPRALQAYGNAEIVLAAAKPACHLTWTTLAGIGSVETNHGTTGGTSLGDDGKPRVLIRGPALDGTAGNKAISDTDGGRYDGDTEWDRAVGPLQFIPTTWERWRADGDNDGDTDPNDIDDAAVAAGYYLCADGRDLSRASDWYAAVYAYNHLDSYVRSVYDRADGYGKASRPA